MAVKTVRIELEGEYAGWYAEMRANVSMNEVVEVQSENLPRIVAALKRVVVSHNFKSVDGSAATDMGDADTRAWSQLIEKWGKALTDVPNA
jgi:hypothetical protein